MKAVLGVLATFAVIAAAIAAEFPTPTDENIQKYYPLDRNKPYTAVLTGLDDMDNSVISFSKGILAIGGVNFYAATNELRLLLANHDALYIGVSILAFEVDEHEDDKQTLNCVVVFDDRVPVDKKPFYLEIPILEELSPEARQGDEFQDIDTWSTTPPLSNDQLDALIAGNEEINLRFDWLKELLERRIFRPLDEENIDEYYECFVSCPIFLPRYMMDKILSILIAPVDSDSDA